MTTASGSSLIPYPIPERPLQPEDIELRKACRRFVYENWEVDNVSSLMRPDTLPRYRQWGTRSSPVYFKFGESWKKCEPVPEEHWSPEMWLSINDISYITFDKVNEGIQAIMSAIDNRIDSPLARQGLQLEDLKRAVMVLEEKYDAILHEDGYYQKRKDNRDGTDPEQDLPKKSARPGKSSGAVASAGESSRGRKQHGKVQAGPSAPQKRKTSDKEAPVQKKYRPNAASAKTKQSGPKISTGNDASRISRNKGKGRAETPKTHQLTRVRAINDMDNISDRASQISLDDRILDGAELARMAEEKRMAAAGYGMTKKQLGRRVELYRAESKLMKARAIEAHFKILYEEAPDDEEDEDNEDKEEKEDNVEKENAE